MSTYVVPAVPLALPRLTLRSPYWHAGAPGAVGGGRVLGVVVVEWGALVAGCGAVVGVVPGWVAGTVEGTAVVAGIVEAGTVVGGTVVGGNVGGGVVGGRVVGGSVVGGSVVGTVAEVGGRVGMVGARGVVVVVVAATVVEVVADVGGGVVGFVERAVAPPHAPRVKAVTTRAPNLPPAVIRIPSKLVTTDQKNVPLHQTAAPKGASSDPDRPWSAGPPIRDDSGSFPISPCVFRGNNLAMSELRDTREQYGHAPPPKVGKSPFQAATESGSIEAMAPSPRSRSVAGNPRVASNPDMTRNPDTASPFPGIQLDGLMKSYGHVQAVRGVSIEIEAGETVALLGPNGAGKSTTIDMLLGLVRPDRGTVSLFGHSPEEAVRAGLVGGMLQTGEVIRELSVRELVVVMASLYPNPRDIDEVLRTTGLAEMADRRASKLSGGQTQRLRFALALVADPSLLVLDEPTVALDVEGRREFWAAMRATAAEGKTVLFATHYLEEADAYADRVILMARGRVVADGTSDEIKSKVGLKTIRATVPDADLGALARLPGVATADHRGDTVVLSCNDSDTALRHLLAEEPEACDIEVRGAGLEEAFLELTGDHEPEGADDPGPLDSTGAATEGTVR